MSETFPTLFKKTETGAIQTWDIRVETPNPVDGPVPPEMHANIITAWGQEGSYGQKTVETIKEGKNPGKKNATTPYQQAVKDARSKWEKQQKARKYVTTRGAALAGERSDLVLGGIDCMLAFPREKKPNALKFPCAVQRKYDGHRMLAHVKDGICTLWSRTRKQVVTMPHIAQALAERFPSGEYWFDGEGYTMKLSFEALTSMLRASEPRPGHEVVEYHIYDIANAPRAAATFQARWVILLKLFEGAGHPLLLAPTVLAHSEEELAQRMEEFLAAGYEGAMARNLDGLYVGKRTPDLLKLKRFLDEDYRIVAVNAETRDVTDSKGSRTMMYAQFTCALPDGRTFQTTVNGDQVEQRRLLSDSLIGKLLTVKFQELTKEGMPRFPKGLRVRQDV